MPVATVALNQQSTASALATAVDAAFGAALLGASTLPEAVLAMDGQSGRKYRMFINNLIARLERPSYLEIGSRGGSTACAAAYGNNLQLTCIDNWASGSKQRDNFYGNVRRLLSDASARLSFLESDFRAVDYSALPRSHVVYLFDGPHGYLDQYDAVRLAAPALTPEFVFIVDDWNWRYVRDGTIDGLRDSGMQVLHQFDVRTSANDTHPRISGARSNWHNGYLIAVVRK